MTEDQHADQEPNDDGTFDADYVKRLRDENAARRTAAKEADDRAAAAGERADRLLAALWDARRAQATADVLADPTDLDGTVEMLDDDGVPDPDRIKAAAEALVEAKPHLAARKVVGDVGQGARGKPTPEPFDLSAVIRERAG
jgi:hypothetical protein